MKGLLCLALAIVSAEGVQEHDGKLSDGFTRGPLGVIAGIGALLCF